MCDEWAKKDKRIRVVHKKNAGLGMARNTGIEYASGKYIFFFDSDDYVDMAIVEKCISSANKHSADSVIYGRFDVYDDGKCIPKKLSPSKDVFSGCEVSDKLLSSMFTYDMGFGVSAWGKMFSIDAIRKYSLRFPSEREIISEDAFFTLEFFSHASVVSIVNECLYYYCKRENSLSRSFKSDRHRKNDEFLKKSVAYAKAENLSQNIITHITARYHMYVVASMKQVIVSEIPRKNKSAILNEMFHSEVVRSSIDADVIKAHRSSLKLFFILLKFRCYLICRILLYCKVKSV